MSSPAISVLMPCYNAAATLDEAVESILGQTRKDIELIAVNDGPGGGSGDLLGGCGRGVGGPGGGLGGRGCAGHRPSAVARRLDRSAQRRAGGVPGAPGCP